LSKAIGEVMGNKMETGTTHPRASFSVLMSVYHKERPDYLEESLDSLGAQTLQAAEVVLVCDGPLTEALEAVIRRFEGILPLRTLRLEKNQGLSAALNAGLRACRHEWVARMDTDDVCLPHRLETLALFLQAHPTADIIGSYAEKIDESGQRNGWLRVPLTPERIRQLTWSCPMIHPTVCFKKDRILGVGGYDPDAGPRQDDYELWFRCASAGLEFHNIPEPLLLYRFTEENIRRNTLRVGWYRLRIGWKGNRLLGAGPLAYLGVMVPFFRGMLPYPLNVWAYKVLDRFNPRHRRS